MKIYHGSRDRIEKPEYGKGKPYNDYGLGFYCTEDIEMAKEWGCGEEHDGFANIYEIDMTGLKILSMKVNFHTEFVGQICVQARLLDPCVTNLNDTEYTILHWLTLLLKNRSFRLTNPIAKDAKEYLLQNFSIDTAFYDVIIGYRANDSYFSFAEDFLNNAISVKKLSSAMRLGNLGEQIVLMSPETFERIQFIDAEKAERGKYYILKSKRDNMARTAYLKSDRRPSYAPDELYMLDIMRQEVKPDDPRLR